MRCNVGVNPMLLSDQHLIAEYYELAMAPGQLRKHKFIIKGANRPEFSMGFAHMNFFKNKLLYLQRRKFELVLEMKSRGFTVNHPKLDLNGFPSKFLKDWQPTLVDSLVVRSRIKERLLLKPDWYRYNREKIGARNINWFIANIVDSECFYV